MTFITDVFQNSEKWLRLVTLIEYGGTVLCKRILHRTEGLPNDGAQRFHQLLPYKKYMQFDDQKQILCPLNEITDESKFDITLYTRLIRVMFTPKYDSQMCDLRKKRNELFHMGNKDMSDKVFNDLWNSTYTMLQGHGFNETVQDLKIDNLLIVTKIKVILDSIEGQIQGII